MQGAVSTGAQRTRCVREHRMRSGNAADGRPWTGSYNFKILERPSFTSFVALRVSSTNFA